MILIYGVNYKSRSNGKDHVYYNFSASRQRSYKTIYSGSGTKKISNRVIDFLSSK